MVKRELMNIQMDEILSRRKVLTGIFWIMAGASVSCSPIRLALDIKKEKVLDDLTEVNRTLKAFVGTVIPGIDDTNPQIVEIFYDKFYKFHKYTCAFSKDLNIRSEKMFGEIFYKLSIQERTKVIEDGLDSNLIATQLYTGAVFFTQIAVYSGLTNNDKGCELIDFKGTYQYVPTYKNTDELLGLPATKTGNPA
jgi:hypothetical protein